VLEGSVRKAGDKIRVTAQLIKADDGFHVWSETFDRNLDDVFVVQDEIAAAVVRGLKVPLLGELPEQRPTDPEVYTLYLQGNYFNKLDGDENAQRALQALQQALAIDPEYAPAWSNLQYTYTALVRYGSLPRDEGIALAMQALEKAIEIDDQLVTAWSGIAWIKKTYFWDWQGARVALEKALQLEPNNASVIGAAGSIASTFGEYEKSIELFERNVESNPLGLSSLSALGNRYRAVGRFEEARTVYERVVALNPEYRQARLQVASLFLFEGRPEEALAKLTGLPDGARFRRIKAAALFDMGETRKAQIALDDFLQSPSPPGPVSIALLYAWRGENDAAFEWLEMALEQRDISLSSILGNPVLTRLKDDPRFPIFLEKIGLREAWEAMPPEYGGPSK
jgi:tetratricopeptide (TPR) repeat protein